MSPVARRQSQHGLGLLDGETHLDGDLPLIDLVLVDAPAGFDDLEPAQVLKGPAGAFERGVDGMLDALGRGAGEFNELIDFVFHKRWPPKPLWGCKALHGKDRQGSSNGGNLPRTLARSGRDSRWRCAVRMGDRVSLRHQGRTTEASPFPGGGASCLESTLPSKYRGLAHPEIPGDFYLWQALSNQGHPATTAALQCGVVSAVCHAVIHVVFSPSHGHAFTVREGQSDSCEADRPPG